MEYTNEKAAICPYCDQEVEESWDIQEDDTELECESCHNKFSVERHETITYSTKKIRCVDDTHNYEMKEFFVSKKERITPPIGKPYWVDKPSSEWKYYKIMECSACDEKDYVEISKEEYDSANT